MTITKGKKGGALKVVIYGPEGVGKSTFASQFPGAVFLDTEGSTNHMEVARFDSPEKWQDILDTVDWCIEHPDQIGTLVIDTMDWAEKLAIRYVCNEEPINKGGDTRHWDNIEQPGYGKGYVYLKAAIQTLLDKLQTLVSKGTNVVITAHAMLRKFEQPDEMGAYDRWALKLNEKNVSPIVKEWADMVLFANFKTDVVKTSDGKSKARGGQKRIMYTQHNACWDAKNRFGLDYELPFEFSQISDLFAEREPVAEVHDEPAPAPEEPTPERIPPKASVTTTDAVPTKAKRTPKKITEEPGEQPEDLKTDDPDKQKLLDALWKNMMDARIYDPLVIRAVVAEKEYYGPEVAIRDYETDFIEGCLIGAWDSVKKLAYTKLENLPF